VHPEQRDVQHDAASDVHANVLARTTVLPRHRRERWLLRRALSDRSVHGRHVRLGLLVLRHGHEQRTVHSERVPRVLHVTR
jgi:hypothetical protein